MLVRKTIECEEQKNWLHTNLSFRNTNASTDKEIGRKEEASSTI